MVSRPGYGREAVFDRTRRSHITPRLAGSPGDGEARLARPARSRGGASPNGCSTAAGTKPSRFRDTALRLRSRRAAAHSTALNPPPPGASLLLLHPAGPPPPPPPPTLSLSTTAAVTSCTRRRYRLLPWSTASRRLVQPISQPSRSLVSSKAAAAAVVVVSAEATWLLSRGLVVREGAS